jgi:hypothetical protein
LEICAATLFQRQLVMIVGQPLRLPGAELAGGAPALQCRGQRKSAALLTKAASTATLD